MFFISLTADEKSNAKYCTFATLDEDDIDDLQELQDELIEYASDSANISTVTKVVDASDPFVGNYNKKASYELLSEPLVVKKVKVEKF